MPSSKNAKYIVTELKTPVSKKLIEPEYSIFHFTTVTGGKYVKE